MGRWSGVGRWLLILVLGWEGVRGFSAWSDGWGRALAARESVGSGKAVGVARRRLTEEEGRWLLGVALGRERRAGAVVSPVLLSSCAHLSASLLPF